MNSIQEKQHIRDNFYSILFLGHTFIVTDRMVNGKKILYFRIDEFLGKRRHNSIQRSKDYTELIEYTKTVVGENNVYFNT